MYLKPISFDGFSLSSGGYTAIIPEDAPASWKAQVVENKRVNAFPQFASVEMDGVTLPILVKILAGGSLLALKKAFDPSSYVLPRPKKLIVQDAQGGFWSCMAVAQNLIKSSQRQVTALLRVSEPVWVSETLTSVSWTVPGADKAITVAGNTWALPTFRLKPTGANPGNYAHNEPITVLNKSGARAVQFPLQIVGNWNTAALVTAGTLRADCADVRMLVDDVEVDAWVINPNTADTDIWINVNLEPKTEIKLGASIPASGAVGEVQFVAGSQAALSKLRPGGAFRIDSEVFTYSGVAPTLSKIGGVTRAQRNTSEAAHAAGATVYFIEHDVRLLWGNAAASARVNDDSRRPAFDLTASDNTQWVYAQFGDKAQLMSATWRPSASSVGKVSGIYTDELNEFDEVWPADVMGAEATTYLSKGKVVGDTVKIAWDLYCPFGFSAVAITAAKKYRVGAKWPVLTLQKSVNGASWITLATESMPVNESTWTDYQVAEVSTGASATYVPTWLRLSFAGLVAATAGAVGRVEVRDAVVKLQTANMPSITRGTEIGNVQLEATLSNTASGDAINIVYPAAVNKTLVVDTANKVITYEGQAADKALGSYPPRGEWLPLLPGANALQYTGVGSGPVDVTIEYRERMVW